MSSRFLHRRAPTALTPSQDAWQNTPGPWSTETVTNANASQYWLGGARFLVCCQRYARGVSSGAYDGRGSTVMRSRGAAKNAWGAARVCYRAPAWSKNSGAVVGSRSLWTPFGSRAECNRPARPCEHRRPETYAIAPQTWEPVRVPLGGPAGGRPRRAHGSLQEPPGATLASAAHRRSPGRRGAARTSVGPCCSSPARRCAVSR